METDRTKPLDAKSQNQLLGRNVFSSVGAKLLYLVSRFFLPPIILAYVTLEEYGIWALCFIFIGYLGMSAFGVSNVYIRYVAEYHARGEHHRIGDLLSTGLILVTGLGTAILIVLWFALPWLIRTFSVSAQFETTAFVLLFGTAAIFVLELSWGAFAYVLTGLQRIVQQNRVWVASFLLETLLVVVLLVAGFGVYSLLYAFALRYLFSISVNVWLCFHNVPGLRISPRRFNRDHLSLFFRYGGVVQLSGLLGMFLRSIEKLIAGVFINVQATGLFDVAQKFPVMATSIPSSINAAFLPATSYMHTRQQRDQVLDLYLEGTRYIHLVTGFLMGFLAAFATPLIVAWLGPNPDYAMAPVILALFTLPFQLNVLTGPASNIYRGMGIPGRELIYPLSQLALVLLLVGAGFLWFGISVMSIALGVALAMVLSAIIYIGYTNTYLGVNQRHFTLRALLPGLWPYLTGFGLYILLRPWADTVHDDRWGSALLVLVAGTLYSLVHVGVLWRFQLDAGEKAWVAQRLGSLGGRFGGGKGARRNQGEDK